MPHGLIVPLERFLSRRFGSVRAGWLTLHRRHWPQRLDRLTAYLRKMKRETEMDDLKVIAPAGETTITMTRSFKAPRALVWKAMTEREHIARWWGLRTSKMKILAHDFRVGGEWRYESSEADGSSMTFYGTYRDITPISQFTNTFGIEDMYPDDGLAETHVLEETDGVTYYTATSRFNDVESRDGMVASGMEGGARQSLNQLDELLAELQAH
jgi:uncharacterized protein YndB with AHSA1/START domain